MHSKKLILIVLVISIILGVLFWYFSPLILRSFKKTSIDNTPVSLKIWGLWEDDSAIRPAIDDYQKLHPNVKISYNHQSSVNYRPRVQTQVSNAQGPDIFMIHNTWLPMFIKTNSLASVPTSIMSPQDFGNTFYPVAKNSLIIGGKIYALPLEIDGLALYYNEDIIKAANVPIPKIWNDFTQAASKATVKDQKGNIVTAGAAMGSTNNVDHWQDILGLLFSQQPGTSIDHPDNSKGEEVIKFFTQFANGPNKTWDPSLESSTQAFYEGKLAFYFAPSWRAIDLRTANPNLKFKVVPVPQLPDGQKTAWASFWAFSVSSNSQNKDAAWEFLKYLTTADVERKLYQEASKTRIMGEPYSRVDLGQEIVNDPIAGAFVAQGPYYKSWYLSSRTFDQGINDEMSQYFENAVNSGDLKTLSRGIQQTLDKWISPVTAPGQ